MLSVRLTANWLHKQFNGTRSYLSDVFGGISVDVADKNAFGTKLLPFVLHFKRMAVCFFLIMTKFTLSRQ